MRRGELLALALSVFVVGCGQPHMQMPMEPPKKPDPAPEMARLEAFVGNWGGTAEMVMTEEMKKNMPPNMKNTFAGANKSDWAMGGMFLKHEGWYEMGEGQKVNYVELVTWCPQNKKYRSWMFNDWGEVGEGWMTMDADGKHCTMEYKGMRPDGTASKGCGTMTIKDPSTMEWTFTEMGPHGKMEFKGVSTKQ
ncbi:MAG: DUF1579 domain-containing protein [Phycisphaerae bacterium]|nr:DUF1579 domain-containing protein [Phycisphaerae bacterium]